MSYRSVLGRQSPGRRRRSAVSGLLAAVLAAGSAVAVSAAGATPASAATTTCSSVSQYGVVYSFDKAYACGRFANGDWWVAPATATGTVRVTAVSPTAVPGRHGLMNNPSSRSLQAYDSRFNGYDATLNVTLPAQVGAGSSLVKGVSAADSCGQTSGHPSCLQTATVLTVLGTPPAGGGATTFRPPYFGTHKPLLSTSAIRTDLLPSVAPVAYAPSIATVRDRFARVQLDHKSSWQARYLHPRDNFRKPGSTKVSNYGADLAKDNNDAVLRLMLNDPIADKMPALVNYLQAGIDWYGTGKGGVTYHADGGHNIGRKIAVTFAAVLLDNADMKAVAGTTTQNAYSENEHVYYSTAAGRALFGKTCRDGMYDTVLAGGSGSRDCRDPAGEIDGGEVAGAAYQRCCTAKSFMASSLAARMLPGGRSTWNADHFHAYADRWASFGTWSAPDTRARFLDLHGTAAGTGHYGSTFQANMWAAYKSYVPPAPNPVSLQLINADTDEEIRTLVDGDVIDVAALGTRRISVRALAPTATESVRFVLDGAVFRTENIAPYALAGDAPGPDYYAWTPSVGDHTVTAKAYSGNRASGSLLGSQTVRFTVR